MSADSPNPTTPTPTMEQTNADTAREVEAFFDNIAAAGQQPRKRSEKGTCQFNITGVGTWYVTIKDGVPTVTRGGTPATPPQAVFTCSPDVFLRIQHREGHLNAVSAVLQGLVVVSGDPALLTTVIQGN